MDVHCHEEELVAHFSKTSGIAASGKTSYAAIEFDVDLQRPSGPFSGTRSGAGLRGLNMGREGPWVDEEVVSRALSWCRAHSINVDALYCCCKPISHLK